MVEVFVQLAGLNKTWDSGISGAIVLHLKMFQASNAGSVSTPLFLLAWFCKDHF